ncbi:MAG: pyruvate kinase [Planctomycetaceae bacterium]|nr:pyruvate kinase [Planctomycetaceae bacterium]
MTENPTPSLSAVSERLTQVKTKIIATVGPACATYEKLRDLVRAGVDVFRLNFAHGTHEWLDMIVGHIRHVSEESGRPIGILGDLSGPKIRLGELVGGVLECVTGQQIEFVRVPEPDQPTHLTCTYEALIDDLRVGNQILMADGAVTLQVIEKPDTNDRVICKVTQPGTIRNRQGINLPGATLSTPSLTPKDREDLVWALKNQIDFLGLSFVRQSEDIEDLRQAIAAENPTHVPQIVAKIEKIEAVNDLERILDATDMVMVARGDLGVEVDIARVPGLQKRIIRLCNQRRIPVITATQMLDSMQKNSRPTRAEASDVANAVLDGSDAIMLSGETAAGDFPLEAVSMMNRLAHEAERLQVFQAPPDVKLTAIRTRALEVTEAVTHGAGIVAEMLEANLIVVATRTGKTALSISNQRLKTPILGISQSAETARKMALYWGVSPQVANLDKHTIQQILEYVVQWGTIEGILHSGSRLVLIASSNWAAQGHDQLLVHMIP